MKLAIHLRVHYDIIAMQWFHCNSPKQQTRKYEWIKFDEIHSNHLSIQLESSTQIAVDSIQNVIDTLSLKDSKEHNQCWDNKLLAFIVTELYGDFPVYPSDQRAASYDM